MVLSGVCENEKKRKKKRWWVMVRMESGNGLGRVKRRMRDRERGERETTGCEKGGKKRRQT